MDLTINQRLKKYLEIKNISHDSFRIEIGVNTQQQFSNWMTCKEKIPEKYFVPIIKRCLDLNARWLLTGEGAMLMEGEAKPYQIKDEKLKIVEDSCSMCAEKDKRIVLLEKHISLLEFSLGKNLKTGSE